MRVCQSYIACACGNFKQLDDEKFLGSNSKNAVFETNFRQQGLDSGVMPTWITA